MKLATRLNTELVGHQKHQSVVKQEVSKVRENICIYPVYDVFMMIKFLIYISDLCFVVILKYLVKILISYFSNFNFLL